MNRARRFHYSFLPLLIAAFASGFMASAEHSLKASDSPKPPDGLRMMTYNIQGGFRDNAFTQSNLEAIRDLIKAQDVDVAVLQEVDRESLRAQGRWWGGATPDPHARKRSRIPQNQHDQAKYLAEGLGYHYEFSGKDWRKGDYGIAILSRYPLKEVKRHTYRVGSMEKFVLAARVDAPEPFYVVNLHMPSGGGKNIDAGIEEVSEWLRSEYPDHESPGFKMVIGGDFNNYIGMSSIYDRRKKKFKVVTINPDKFCTQADEGFKNYQDFVNILDAIKNEDEFLDPFYTCRTPGNANDQNFFATKSSNCKASKEACKRKNEYHRRIDHLLYRGLACANYRVLTDMKGYSDHYPVIVDLIGQN